MISATLEARLAAAASRLTERVRAEMYEDPFWMRRFGERGRTHTRRDGDFHIQYLVEALAGDDVGVFERYARWLREVLVSRGMCSRHLAENYQRLAAAIEDEGWPDGQRAIDVLLAGARALTHGSGDSAVLDAAGMQLTVRPGGLSRSDDVAHGLSYLADALALDRGDLFVAHVEFVARWGPARPFLDGISGVVGGLDVSPAPGALVAAAYQVVQR